MNLRDLAKDRPCQIRVPGFCLRENSTVVLCHVRMVEIVYDGGKANDFLGAHGCYACHAVVDGQRNSEFTYDQRRLMLLEGVMRTQAWLLREHVNIGIVQ